MSQTEYFEIKNLLLETREKLEKLELLIPEKFEISYVSQKTGLTRQGVRKKLYVNYEPEVDFWYEGGKIFLSQKVALQMLK
ncbi:hypothetical protein [Arcobacter porcinus]|uniref:Uncharacterized protein n=1 Tax=Arcobacter porcinus TaxID=1935204 RepID=A0A5C2HC43_9BACT|nr:hypothetical protein [Arcobacter porcinus]OCL89402.1 hypothetical protein AAX27_01933 [Aliarcobacter thereius]QEP40453.1 hypothetical protein APORC_0845 [Arcobacter porcinus]